MLPSGNSTSEYLCDLCPSPFATASLGHITFYLRGMMNRKEVWDLVRRLRVRLVVDNRGTSDNRRVNVLKKRQEYGELYTKSHGVLDILCKPSEAIPNNSNDFQFEIIRLRRRVDELECIVRDRDSRVITAIAMLEDELVMYRSLLHDHV